MKTSNAKRKARQRRREAKRQGQGRPQKLDRAPGSAPGNHADQIGAADRVRPTPETVAHLEPDPLQDLVGAGLIDAAGERAAQEIMLVYCAVCRGVMRQSRPLGPYTPGVFDMSEDIAEAHARRYLPWARATRRQTVQATIDLVVDRLSPPTGPVRTAVIEALDDYARRFGRAHHGDGDTPTGGFGNRP